MALKNTGSARLSNLSVKELVGKEQLEQNVEQLSGSKLGMEYYLTLYMVTLLVFTNLQNIS